MEVRGQLACQRVKWKHKKRNCKPYMCLYVHVVSRTHDVYLCKSVKTHNSCKGMLKRVKYEPLEQTTCCWVGQSKQNRVDNMFMLWRGTQSYSRMRLRWTYSRGVAGNSCSSMY
jgi:hypothetical protein